MARLPKNGKSSVVTATTLILPTPSANGKDGTIAKLSKAKRNARKQMRDIGQVFSDKFAKAQENDHVDRRAANIAFNLDALSDEQLHVTYFHLMAYLDDLGVTARATKQEELFTAGTGLALKKGQEDDDTDDTNVRPIGSAARKVAEQAGERA